MTPRIRRGVTGDLGDLVKLEQECFHRDPWGADSLRQGLEEPGYLVLVATADATPEPGEILGYLVGWRVGEEADLARLGVTLERRRTGLGLLLLQEALRHWTQAGVEKVFLDVRAGNVAAIALYLGLQFEVVGRRPGYYADGEDAVLLLRSLMGAASGQSVAG